MEVLEEIVRLYREKVITIKEAADRVIEFIYKNPQYFRFENLQDDLKSEFILAVYSKIAQIIETYNPSKSLFRTYLVTTIITIRKSLFKSHFREMAQLEACNEYAEEEYNMNIAEPEPEYENELKQLDRKNMPEDVKKYLTSCLPKMPDSTKIMMLALKSEHFIKAEHIQKLHEVTGIKENEILDMFLKLRGVLYKKKTNYFHHKELQNKSYILKKRSAYMLNNLHEKTNLYETLKNSTRYQHETWKRHTEIIKSLHTFVPTNHDVSKVLGISDPQIRRLQKFIEGFQPSKKKKN